MASTGYTVAGTCTTITVDSSVGGALGGRGSEPEFAMRPKVKPRQSHVRKGETVVVSTNFFGKNSETHGASQLFSR